MSEITILHQFDITVECAACRDGPKDGRNERMPTAKPHVILSNAKDPAPVCSVDTASRHSNDAPRSGRHELAEGADADLMQANRQRSRVAFGLIGLALVLGLLSAKLRMPAMLEHTLRIASAVSGVVGLVLAKWAQAEHRFLMKPEPEGPPEIFKDRPD